MNSQEVPKKNPNSLSTSKTIDFSAVSADELRAEVKERSIQFYGAERYADVQRNITELIESKDIPVVSFDWFHQILSLTGVAGHNVALALIMEWGLEKRISDFQEKFDAWLDHVAQKQQKAAEAVASVPEAPIPFYTRMIERFALPENRLDSFEHELNALNQAERFVMCWAFLDGLGGGSEELRLARKRHRYILPYIVKLVDHQYDTQFRRLLQQQSVDMDALAAEPRTPEWGVEFARLVLEHRNFTQQEAKQ